jgi:TPR repeat protein
VLLPVLAAAVLGAVLALATIRGRTEAAEQPAQQAPAASPSAIELSTSALQPAPLPPPGSASVAAASPSVPASSSAAAGATQPPRTVVLTAITTAEELYQAEVECDRKKLPESCERVARALEAGSAGTRDATRAAKLRRVALTLYVKQCETDRALACTRLAEMHEQGDQIQKNPRNAAALRDRVNQLCRLRPNQLGCQDER